MTQKLNAYFQKLENRCQKVESNVCVGLDPDPERMPKKFVGAEGTYQFCSEIIGATSDYAAAYKPNIAFFESLGTEGWHVLAQVLEHVPKDIPVIIDAKRGDIGTTARHYAHSIFRGLKADAVTVNPFLGGDSIKPFTVYKNNGIYFLCLTSNPGAADFQLWFDLYLQIAKKVVEWNEDNQNCGLVMGATHPRHLANVRHEAPDIPLLIPGIGAQGGELEAVVSVMRGKQRHRALINVSRTILYASAKTDFARAARKALILQRDRINMVLNQK